MESLLIHLLDNAQISIFSKVDIMSLLLYWVTYSGFKTAQFWCILHTLYPFYTVFYLSSVNIKTLTCMPHFVPVLSRHTMFYNFSFKTAKRFEQLFCFFFIVSHFWHHVWNSDWTVFAMVCTHAFSNCPCHSSQLWHLMYLACHVIVCGSTSLPFLLHDIRSHFCHQVWIYVCSV